MNKKAFTLVELAGVITILGVVSVLIVPLIINQIRNNKDKIDEVTKNLIYSATDLYLDNKKDEFPLIEDSVYCVSLQNLVDDGKLEEPILDSNGSVIDLKTNVRIEVNSNNYEFSLLNNCENDIS